MTASLLVALALTAAVAASTDAPVAEGRAEVWTNELSSIAGTRHDVMLKVEMAFSGTQLRMEFRGADGKPYALLRPGADAPLVMLDAHGSGLPLPGGRLPLFFDPGRPCAGFGMLSDCRALGNGTHSGRNATGWSYRSANRRGPGLSDEGQMWLDAETGLVLGYTSQRRSGAQGQWLVLRVHYGPQDAALFELPEASRWP